MRGRKKPCARPRVPRSRAIRLCSDPQIPSWELGRYSHVTCTRLRVGYGITSAHSSSKRQYRRKSICVLVCKRPRPAPKLTPKKWASTRQGLVPFASSTNLLTAVSWAQRRQRHRRFLQSGLAHRIVFKIPWRSSLDQRPYSPLCHRFQRGRECPPRHTKTSAQRGSAG